MKISDISLKCELRGISPLKPVRFPFDEAFDETRSSRSSCTGMFLLVCNVFARLGLIRCRIYPLCTLLCPRA